MDHERTAAHLSRNVKALREARGWTQRELAERAGVPRPTVTRLESGSPNPTFHVVASVAAALDVSLEELVASRGTGERLVTADELPRRARAGVVLRQVLPEPWPGVVFERMELAPRSRLTGAPHAGGSREYLVCESGRVALRTLSHRWELGPGDVVAYAGDQPHSYANHGESTAVAYTLVLHGPVEARPG
jgi:transcriptional regulator with XRE-family HTH domain